MAERSAVIGVGQTICKSKREDVSIAGLVREAALAALDDAGLTFADIDAVVIGKAPDMFEGVMMPELYLAPALGAVGKPMFRVHTAGSVGGSTSIVAAHLVASGVHQRVLTVAFEKQSDSDAMWALSVPQPFAPPLLAGAGGYFAPIIRAYIHRSGAPRDIGMMVAVKDRLHALKNPYAHLHLPDISMQMVEESIMLWDPLHYLESCPSSDGACAVVFPDQKGGEDAARDGRPPAWVLGSAVRSEPSQFPGRDAVAPRGASECAEDVYRQAGITRPREQIDCAEIYVPFSWYEPMWLEAHHLTEPGQGWRLVEDGTTALDGAFPVNMSGGVLSSNPIGASGLLRFAEAALQVRGMAGEHQVDGAKVALAQAYGAANQYFSMWIVAGSPDPVS